MEELIIVKSIEDYDKKRRKITLDNGEQFLLYLSDIRKYDIIEGEDISFRYSAIKDMLISRAKERALYMLKDSDKTSHQVRTKLRTSFYTDDIIDEVLIFLNHYRYIDDERYAITYIKQGLKNKSIRQISNELIYNKGISKDIIKQVIDDIKTDNADVLSSEYAIQAILTKKKYDKESCGDKDRRRIYAYLVSKGFDYDDIKRCMD